jgi:hypothetical protein
MSTQISYHSTFRSALSFTISPTVDYFPARIYLPARTRRIGGGLSRHPDPDSGPKVNRWVEYICLSFERRIIISCYLMFLLIFCILKTVLGILCELEKERRGDWTCVCRVTFSFFLFFWNSRVTYWIHGVSKLCVAGLFGSAGASRPSCGEPTQGGELRLPALQSVQVHHRSRCPGRNQVHLHGARVAHCTVLVERQRRGVRAVPVQEPRAAVEARLQVRGVLLGLLHRELRPVLRVHGVGPVRRRRRGVRHHTVDVGRWNRGRELGAVPDRRGNGCVEEREEHQDCGRGTGRHSQLPNWLRSASPPRGPGHQQCQVCEDQVLGRPGCFHRPQGAHS